MKNKKIKIIFGVITLLSVLPILLGIIFQSWGILDGFVSTLVTTTFFYLAYLIIVSYVMTKKPIFLAWFAALFIWPIINAAISFYLTGPLVKSGAEIKIGGFGDFISASSVLDDLALGSPFVRIGLFLMLATNLAFLLPVIIMHKEITKSQNDVKNLE